MVSYNAMSVWPFMLELASLNLFAYDSLKLAVNGSTTFRKADSTALAVI